MEFLLKRNELLKLREFIDAAIRYSEPGAEPPPEADDDN